MRDTVEEKYVINGEVVDFFISVPPLRIFVKNYIAEGWIDSLDMFFVDKDNKVVDKITIEADGSGEGYSSITYRSMKGGSK